MIYWPRWIDYVVLAISLGFTVAGGAIALGTGEAQGWLAMLFFGACAAAAVTSLWPHLMLDRRRSRDNLLSRYPGPVDLRASMTRSIYLPLASLGLASGIAWTLSVGEDQILVQALLLWCGLILFGGGALIQIAMLVWRPKLTLSAEGLGVSSLWRRGLMRWSDIGNFEIWYVPPTGLPVVVFEDRTGRGPSVGRYDRALTGRNASLSDGYGLSPDELVLLLSQWQKRVLETSGTKSSEPASGAAPRGS